MSSSEFSDNVRRMTPFSGTEKCADDAIIKPHPHS